MMGAAAIMVNHVMGDGRHAEEEKAEEREMCVSDQRIYLNNQRMCFI
jgi:hypothetical protein